MGGVFLEKGIEPGDWIQGPFWQGVVQVVSILHRPDHGHDIVTVYAPKYNQSRTYIITDEDWEQVERVVRSKWTNLAFSGNPEHFRLGVEAHRLRLSHSIDPYAALNASRIDPLPHQFEAVYEHLLSRPVVRALLAHDAGAGKTIMSGMLIKELKRRQGTKRILIVAPAGLTGQWRRELLTKFGEDFTIISRDYMNRHRLDSLDVWRETDTAIVSVDFARQKNMRRALESVEWDFVIVDEAHKMAAYMRSNYAQKTQAYQLGEVLSRHSVHLLLMTATPHKGDPDNYRFLISLVSPQWGDASQYIPASTNPVVLRRTKEEMRKPNGDPLYPERIVEPKYYSLSPKEGELLEAVQKFVHKRYQKAKNANRQSAAFALITLGRRLASSPYALLCSLERIKKRTETRLSESHRRWAELTRDADDWYEWEELSEEERWQLEEQAEMDAADLTDVKQLRAEVRQLDALIADTEAVIQQGQQQKIKELKQACDTWIGEEGEQLIIFTEFKDTLSFLVERLHEWGYTTTEIHGGMALKERRQSEKAFWNGDAQVLVATEAAGEGINLQCCRVMVNFDIPWNPGRLEQRMGRIHRYGQKADQVFIFNLIAQNSMEGEVQQALLGKLAQMKSDMGDKVFDVVGTVLWSQLGLPQILERISLGDRMAIGEARRLIDQAGDVAREALEAEKQITATAAPLDIEAFQQKQATFRARRLSPEAAEKFFAKAIIFAGGSYNRFSVEVEQGEFNAFEVTLPANLFPDRLRQQTVSFWSPICTDDETEDDAILFIAPGHWLFEGLLDVVIERCMPDLDQGAVFFDIQPQDDKPYLVWFVRSFIRNGLDERVGDLLAAVGHRADQERVRPMATEVLEAFEIGEGDSTGDGVRRVQPMLAAQEEVIDQCIQGMFLPELLARRYEQHERIHTDWDFLNRGLSALVEKLSDMSVLAYSEGNVEDGERFADQSDAASRRLNELGEQMSLASHLLMAAPEVMGVALVIPEPVEIALEGDGSGTGRVTMRRDEGVEHAAMAIVMDYEQRQGRNPRDVSSGSSWDIESDNAEGVITRYIEVKGRGPAEAGEVMLTEPEWEAARRLGDQHWLYIVRLGDGMMWRIQNPYNKLRPKELKRWIVRVQDTEPYAETEAING